jgi:predicted RNase H-like HicB family nuclease
MEMRLQVIIEKNPEGGFTASCVEIPGAISQGETTDEAVENVREAIELILDVRRKAARKGPGQLKLVEVDA